MHVTVILALSHFESHLTHLLLCGCRRWLVTSVEVSLLTPPLDFKVCGCGFCRVIFDSNVTGKTPQSEEKEYVMFWLDIIIRVAIYIYIYIGLCIRKGIEHAVICMHG